jgi:flagellar basal-body rod protein FlgF
MVDAIGAAVASMTNDIARMTVIGQNLANASTSGYRREMAVATPFQDVLATGAGATTPTVAPGAVERMHDFKPGVLQATRNPLDLAIEGDGFFEIQTDAGARYTRQGNFRLDALGRLVNEAGAPVMGDAGEILLKSGQASIDAQGRILEGDRPAGQLRIARFTDPHTLAHLGSGMYAMGEGSTLRSDGYARVRQGFLEGSNVNPTQEMVKMIETVRHFESGQKVIQAYDDMLSRALGKLGEF